MTERLASQVPSQEKLEAEYRGITFEQFKQLSDEQLDALYEERRQELQARIDKDIADLENGKSIPTELGPEYWAARQEALVFLRFTKWRKYGVPDRDMTYDDIWQYVEELVRSRIEKDPEYGKLSADQYENLSPYAQNEIDWIMDYLYDVRESFEPFTIDAYSLHNTLSMTEAGVRRMVEHGVLEGLGASAMVGGIYQLTEPYTNNLLVEMITANDDVDPDLGIQ